MALPDAATRFAIQRQTSHHVVLYMDGAKRADFYGEQAESDAMLMAHGREVARTASDVCRELLAGSVPSHGAIHRLEAALLGTGDTSDS